MDLGTQGRHEWGETPLCLADNADVADLLKRKGRKRKITSDINSSKTKLLVLISKVPRKIFVYQ